MMVPLHHGITVLFRVNKEYFSRMLATLSKLKESFVKVRAHLPKFEGSPGGTFSRFGEEKKSTTLDYTDHFKHNYRKKKVVRIK